MELPEQLGRITSELVPELLRVGGWFKGKSLVTVLTRADFRCEYCSQDLMSSFNECFNAQTDHIIPKSKGGSEEESNLAACCSTCNVLKWEYVPPGDSRQERVAAASKYVSEKRKEHEVFWNKYRRILKR